MPKAQQCISQAAVNNLRSSTVPQLFKGFKSSADDLFDASKKTLSPQPQTLMESVDGEFASANAPPSSLFSFPLRTEYPATAADDSDEWEYEYSMTETEVCLITSKHARVL